MTDKTDLSPQDLHVLRTLGEWQARACETPENREKVEAWIAHDDPSRPSRPMVIAETHYLSDARRPVTDADLQCADPWARQIELRLRQRQYEIERLRDDHMVAPWIEYCPHVGAASDFGVPSGVQRGAAGADKLAFNYRPPLLELDDADFARLRHRTFRWDREGEERERERLETIFAGILPVRRRNAGWQLAMPMTSTVLDFVGLDGFMLLMFTNPEGLHRLMRFICDDHRAYLRFWEENQLLSLNNETDYVGSGCMGTSRLLPAADFAGTVRPKDLWYYCESQESVGLSPKQYGEFVFPYVKELADPFGRVYYGCCEPVDPFAEYLATMPNLQRVSVSPWADEEKVGRFCAEKKIVYSRKPSPNLFMGEKYDEGAVRAHLQKTVDCTQGCRVEFIQRDVYVTNEAPDRFIRWVELVREAARRHDYAPR
jgi:hypothetical protein